ncbi:MAG: response regulator transcription factor [Rhodocyclaceae bacterium]
MPPALRNSRVHLIENDADLRHQTVSGLAELGFEVEGFPDAPAFYRGLIGMPCHIAVVNADLPGEDGYSVARHLRASGDIGIVLLTPRDDAEERIRSLRDADFFLPRPFELRELAAVLQSLDRRLSLKSPRGDGTPEIRHAIWSLIDSGWTLHSSLGTRVPLTHTESLFMQALTEVPGQVVMREDLAERLVGDGNVADYDLHRLEALVSRLRRKFNERGAELPVRAVRGVGYLFVSAML